MSRESLSGLGILTRNSMSLHSRRGSNISLLAANTLESFHSVDDRNWSWSALRNTFRSQGLGDLYIRYSRRLQNAYFNVYLMLQMSISLIYLVSILIANYDTLENAVPEALAHVIICTSCITMFFFICDERMFRESPRAQIICSVIIVVLITGLDISLSFYFYYQKQDGFRVIRTASAFQTLIIIYFFLPLPRKYQPIVLGAAVSVAHLLASGICFYAIFEDPGLRVRRTLADAVYYTCGNLVGIYSKLLSEITVRRAFLDRRGYIKSTIKKDYETKQEEQLLHSILPTHISAQVKHELMAVFQEIEESESSHYHNRAHRGSNLNQNGVMRKKPFSQLFVERHNDVTILFADIVNFTPLTVRLSAEDLVETLNQLFGKFDQAAKQYDCLRIKLLGDCYYCVSGLSNATPHHAKNCILLGLEMIDIIRGVREKQKVNVEMRIGVHSGNIISGLLGIYKWQYDIWSKDVTIANHMEQAGKPGKVHITRQTKDYVEKDEVDFTFKRAFHRDKYLKENNIETYLVVPKGEVELSVIEDDEVFNPNTSDAATNNAITKYASKNPKTDGEGNSISTSRTGSESGVQGRIHNRKKFEKRLTDVTGDHVNILRSMWNTVDKQMEEAIEKMPLRKIDQWCGNGTSLGETINHVFLNFNSWDFEKQFITQPDPLFKYYIVCALVVLVCMGIIQALIMPSYHIVLWIAFCIAASYLLTLVPCVWVSFLWNRLKDPHREREFIPDPENPIVLFFYKMANRITRRWIIRTIIYISVALVLSAFAIVDVVECNEESNEHEEEMESTYLDCPNPWYFTYSCTLAILAIYGFFRINFLVKIFLCIFSITSYALVMFNFRNHVFGKQIGNSPAVEDPIYAHLIYIIKIILLLHIMDRQMEYINRLDFIWKKKLTEEHKAASMTHATNAILIHNILPQQIAKIYLDPTRIGASYSRSYTDVSVMFASIPNFMDFYTETDLNDHGIKCLQLLNEIIVDFDNALFEFEDIEKIKVIGSTYMAACGLEVQETGRMSNASNSRYHSSDSDYMPLRRSFEEAEARPSLDKRRKTLVTLVKFAAVMMVRLKSINKDAFQDFELRVGIDSGSIIAGVIGAQTPHYDIWGDTVNMASRMDSHGVNGKIQVAEGSALLLIQSGVKCQFRDKMSIKGKDRLIPTYFVKLDENLNVEFEDQNIVKRTDTVTTQYDDYY